MRWSVPAVLALSGVATSMPAVIEERQTSGIQAALSKTGRYFGTSVTIRNDNQETALMRNKNEFGSVTPENSMKWDTVQGSRGSFNYGGGDQVANFASQNGHQLRCHTLVWYSQLPGWVNGVRGNSTVQGVMQTHINAAMGHWKGKCTHWDVVNEALNEDGTYRDNVFLREVGEAYLPISFKFAQAADPGTKLYYNDYNLEYGGAKTQGAVKIVKLVQSWGVRIDGVGLQGHMVSEPTGTQSTPCPAQDVLEKSLRAFTDLGVDVAYTEVDIRMKTPSSAAKLQAQAAAWGRMMGSCLAVERCVGFTVWGVSDAHSWVPQTFSGEDFGLLWDKSYQKKPGYQAILDAIAKWKPAT